MSGLELTFAGLDDPRLVNFILEHGYRWLLGYPAHADFWSPPVYYPHTNISAYSDVLIGVGPFYWVWRALGCEPDTAFLWWNLTVWSLNYGVMFVLLRRFFDVGVSGATAGSLLFAFGAPRTLNIGHLQLVPNFYCLIAIMALFGIFGDRSRGLGRRTWIAVGCLAVVLQAYTAFYPFYILAFGLGLAAIWGLVFRDTRLNALNQLRREWMMLAGTAVIGCVLIWPLASHYLQAYDELGGQRYIKATVPRPASWVLMGQRNTMYGWLQSPDGPFAHLQRRPHSNGIGFLTLGLSLVGIWWGRRRRAVQVMCLVVASIFALSVMYPGGFTFWRYIHQYLPGAAALRVTGRVTMVLLVLGGVGVALFFDHLWARRRYVAAGLLALLCTLEQHNRVAWIPIAASRGRVRALTSRVDPSCQAFLLVSPGAQRTYYSHLDAAWVTLAIGVPTVNGRYGHRPPKWGLRDVHIGSPEDEQRIRSALDSWVDVHGLNRERVCVIKEER